jgi:hypothetical protein
VLAISYTQLLDKRLPVCKGLLCYQSLAFATRKIFALARNIDTSARICEASTAGQELNWVTNRQIANCASIYVAARDASLHVELA